MAKIELRKIMPLAYLHNEASIFLKFKKSLTIFTYFSPKITSIHRNAVPKIPKN